MARAPRDRLGRPPWWVLPVVVVAGLALHLPSLGLGFWADDYTHQLVLDGALRTAHLRPASLYDFGYADDWASPEVGDAGQVWWVSPDWKVRFLRPLASLMLRIDHRLFGGWAPGYHLTSLVWYAAALLLAHALYRALGLGPWTALLGTTLWATSNCGVLPVGWIANRNTVEATVLTLAAVVVAARTPTPRRVLLSLALAAAACAAKESGVAAFPLVALMLLLRGRDSEDARVRRVAVLGAVAGLAGAAVYVVGLAAAGYGTRSAFYATPWGDPARYLVNLGILFSAGSLRLIAPVSLDLMQLTPGAARVVPWLGLAIVGPLAFVVARSLWRSTAAAFLAVWIVLSLLPQGGTLPSDRLLMEAAVGSAGLLALFVARAFAAGHGERGRRWRRGLAVLLLATAGVLSGALAVVQQVAMTGFARETRRVVLDADVGAPELGTREVFLLQSGSGFVAMVTPQTWWVESGDHDLRFRPIQLGPRGLEWRREDATTCVVESLDEPFFNRPFEAVYRSTTSPPAVGEVYRAGDLEVEIAAVDGSGVRAVRLRFPRDLDDPRHRFLVDRGGRLTHQPPPAIGATLIVPKAPPTIPMLP